MRAADLTAGLSVAGLMLPEAVAYAAIAGLPPQRAILAAIAGCLVYAVVGRSRFAIVSPTSSSAAILAATLAAMPGDVAAKAVMVTIIVAFAGGLFLIAAAMRLGALTGFIARPVLRGFAFGLAITIILRQLPSMTGTPIAAPDLWHLITGLIAAMPRWHMASIAIGGAALALLILLRRFPAIPGAFVVLAAGIAASVWLRLPDHGVAVVGPIAVLPDWTILALPSWADISRLAQFAVPLVLILFAESWGTIRALALRHGDSVDPNRELGALGFANLASALVQGMPVGAGFSAGSASEAAGAATRATAAIAAIGLALLIACAAPLVARLPLPVLAAVVIVALTHALNPAPLARLWRIGRDQYVGLGAAAAVLLFGVLDGMLIAMAVSMAAMFQRLAAPHVARLGLLGTHTYVDVARHADAVPPAGIGIWRPAEPLFFANADRILGQIARSAKVDPGVKAIVVSLEDSFDLDSSALDALIEFDASLGKAGLRVRYARMHDHVRDLLTMAGAGGIADRGSYSVDDAVKAMLRAEEPG